MRRLLPSAMLLVAQCCDSDQPGSLYNGERLGVVCLDVGVGQDVWTPANIELVRFFEISLKFAATTKLASSLWVDIHKLVVFDENATQGHRRSRPGLCQPPTLVLSTEVLV